MPAYWTPIPGPVVDALLAATGSDGDQTGYVRYSDVASYLPPTS